MTTPALPDPATWANGPIPAYQLRSDVAGTVALLQHPPMFIGQQTLEGQSINSSITTAVDLDTELYDNANGHQVSSNPQTYYGQFAGWYLCEGSVPLNYTGGAGSLSAEIGTGTGGGAATFAGGQRGPNNSGRATVMNVAALVPITLTGYGTGDYIQLGIFQSSGGFEPVNNATTKAPTLMCKWVAALAGTTGLPVPANPAWATPPSIVTAAFLNANVRDVANFLIFPPIVGAKGSSGGSLASQSGIPATGTKVTCPTEDVDNYTAYVSGTFTAPVGGVYYFYGQVGVTTAAGGGALGAGLTVNSGNYNGGSTFTIWGGTLSVPSGVVQCANVRRRLRLDAGDTVNLAGFYNDTGGASATLLTTSSAWAPRFIAVWENG